MYIPSDPKVIQAVAEDGFVRRWAFWLPLVIAALLVYLSPDEYVSLSGALKLFTWLPVLVFPSIDVWASRSSFPENTRVLFSFFAYASIYYAVLVAGWDKYKLAFIGARNSPKRHLKPLIVALYLLPPLLLFSVALPAEEKCLNLCIHASRLLQLIYAFLLSFWLGFGLASLYWWIRNFSKIHF
ncbi:hypothetical protein CCU68_31990 [Pseudomonas gingeri NCPPB 3146 = LMG 5327]|uniref:Transmembrane protein n=2 Tax=Pseudomonas gingeri TaxID=117681 RepID=A0A7Y8CBB0_9PSED|nr:hypothetical protein [Pseudomonas gingeri]NWC13015.1 hypothetical protein [Pseudomonas gingeri]PNQ88481.1 hypothetical protein CCU68_31990 [Pseudomonas gingeri NCPPB 3146 = LMG 5327]